MTASQATDDTVADAVVTVPLDDVLEAIATTTLSRAAVETSTPEQIVWLTADAIAENVRLLAHDIHPGYHTARERMTAQVNGAINDLSISVAAKTKALAAVTRALEGWPS